jgi:putative OPT family oligopeptide transporter
VFAPVLSTLHHAYTIGSDKLQAPQATLFASLTQGFFGDGTLPLDMVGVGAAIGAAIVAVDLLLQWRGSTFRLHIMPVAVGMYLPLTTTFPILIGGLLRAALTRGRTDDAKDPGVLFGSGLVAGEALMGIGLAAAAPLAWFPLIGESNALVSIAAFLFLLAIYVSFTRSAR